jgi:hypothetical protein
MLIDCFRSESFIIYNDISLNLNLTHPLQWPTQQLMYSRAAPPSLVHLFYNDLSEFHILWCFDRQHFNMPIYWLTTHVYAFTKCNFHIFITIHFNNLSFICNHHTYIILYVITYYLYDGYITYIYIYDLR